jgi:hypothetical protein
LDEVQQVAQTLISELERGSELADRASAITQLYDEQLCNFDKALRQLGVSEEMLAHTDGTNQGGDLSKLYSMESERELHLEIFGGAKSPAESREVESSNSDFGDGVELF